MTKRKFESLLKKDKHVTFCDDVKINSKHHNIKDDYKVKFSNTGIVYSYKCNESEVSDKRRHTTAMLKSSEFYQRRYRIFGVYTKDEYRKELKSGFLDKIENQHSFYKNVDGFYEEQNSSFSEIKFSEKEVEKRKMELKTKSPFNRA
jgi:hypothetical protein